MLWVATALCCGDGLLAAVRSAAPAHIQAFGIGALAASLLLAQAHLSPLLAGQMSRTLCTELSGLGQGLRAVRVPTPTQPSPRTRSLNAELVGTGGQEGWTP